MKLLATLFFTAAISMQIGCSYNKNVQLGQDRLLIGEWMLTSMQNGEKAIANTSYEVIYQFTADKQLVIKTPNKRDASKYTFANNLLIVDDGNITNIKEKIQVQV